LNDKENMEKRFLRCENGFSLAEILVVVGLTSVLAAGAFVLFSSGSAAWFSTEGQTRLQENNRKVMQRVAQELRQTSGVQIAASDTIRFALPVLCSDPEDDSQTLICQEPENFAQSSSNFSANYAPLEGEVGDLVEGDAQVVSWNFTGLSAEDPLIIYYNLGSGEDRGDTKYAIRAGSSLRAPKYWRYEESDVYPGQPEDWTLLGGSNDDSISWTTGELKIFGSGLGLKQYRRLVIEESFQDDSLEIREVRIINDELIWGAPLRWGCTAVDCMEEGYLIEYTLNDDGQFVRNVLDDSGNAVQSDIWSTNIIDVQFSLSGSGRLLMSITSEITTLNGRILTAQTTMEVFLRN
jgi:hypothetical protein